MMKSLNRMLMNSNQEIKKSLTLNLLDREKLKPSKKIQEAIQPKTKDTTSFNAAALSKNSNFLLKVYKGFILFFFPFIT